MVLSLSQMEWVSIVDPFVVERLDTPEIGQGSEESGA